MRKTLFSILILLSLLNLSSCCLKHIPDPNPSVGLFEKMELRISGIEKSVDNIKADLNKLSAYIKTNASSYAPSFIDHFDLYAFKVFGITCIAFFSLVTFYIKTSKKFKGSLLCLFMLFLTTCFFSFISKFQPILYSLSGISATIFIMKLIFRDATEDIAEISNFIPKLLQFDVTPETVEEKAGPLFRSKRNNFK